MTHPDPKTEAFFEDAPIWQAELRALRAILLNCDLTEIFKWRGPCYCFEGGNVATLWGFKDACVLGYFKGVLLPDPAGILMPPGENSRAVRMVKFTALAQITAATATLTAYTEAAIALEKSGAKVTFAKDDLPYPEELITALDDNPDLALAFDALTPGRRRGYLLHFNQPKTSATKMARITKHTPRILEGKGMNDR
ncbi:YdeI/OmpD-associated family protein [Cypionkella psychrotolerans]|uniref:YdeI/OmpD-associated family protein n=1 Tax=Cypionkella psychrotolerans TaxID=1678131 RepID=UPI0006B4918C|nr:YdeI/OmpD-associated family protein [Cypionkella psychrotolerans]